jgi:tetratricopeptide (TPR) repeat protein/tRNA A-37 threonylcarbamoyl transferase component Bud32
MPKMIDNRYKVVERLGAGEAGEVYRVHDKVKDREVALKLLTRSGSEERLLRLKREFVTVAGLKHPNIVQVYDFMVRDREPSYFTMEYIDGVGLTEVVKSLKQKKEKYDLLFILTIQICQALEFIHSRGLMHCDIKPGNVLVTKDKKPSVRLLDFGLAESVDLSLSEGMKGTVEYMAPEVIRGYPVDRRADLYSLGVLLYEATVGRPPFQAATPVSVLKQHLQESPTPPDECTKGIPDGLSRIIVKLLSKRPEDRYQSAREIISEIGELTGKPVTLATEKGWLLSGCFAGRDVELSRLNELLSRETGVTLLVTGDMGIGKSRLIQEFRVQAQLSGWGFWECACSQEERTAYGPIVRMLGDFVRATESKHSDLVKNHAEALGHFVPRIGKAISTPVSSVAGAEKTQLLDAVVRFLLESSQREPYVLFVDDVEWAEEATVEFLRYLVRNVERGRIILCFALSEEQMVRKEALGPMIEEVGERIHLEGLGRDETEALIISMIGGDRLPRAHVDGIFEETRGNPLFVQELVRSMAGKTLLFSHGKWVVEESDSADAAVSRTMQELLRDRLKGLTKQVYDVLEIGSVFGKEFELNLIGSVAEYSDEDLLNAARELLRRRLIVERADGYCFASSQLKEIVYEGAKKGRRRELHQSIAELLETRAGERVDAVAGELAYHFSRGVDKEKAFIFSVKAGETARLLYADREAAGYLEQALRFIDRESDRYGPLVRELGDTYRLMGEYDRAIDRYREGLVLSPSTSDEADVYCDIGVSYRKKGEHDSALKAYETSMSILTADGDERVRARLLQEMSWVYQAQAKYDEAGYIHKLFR